MRWACALVLLELAAVSLGAQSAAAVPSKTAAAKNSHHSKRRLIHNPKQTYQTHPDPERYQEIQKVLADRGYFKGEVNGQWGQDSIDALQRFQTDQKLPNDGKISALTLTGLGLGPKHDGNDVTPSSTQAPSAPASAPLARPPDFL